MIKSFTITNYLGDSIKLSLNEPEKSGFIVKSVSGLGPCKANINSTEVSTNDGSLFNSARLGTRNIVFELIFSENLSQKSIEDIRQRTYKYFPIKKSIEMLIETDNRIVKAIGYVEANEPNIFSAKEGTQISVICPDPYFYEFTDNQMAFVGVQPIFEFPFENNSLSENLLEFGEIRLDTRATLDYKGDADTGVVISIHANDAATGIALYNIKTKESMLIDTDKIGAISGAPFGQGDDIVISTVKGNKYVKLLRNGVYTNVIAAMNKDADWFQLTNGQNMFNFTAKTGENSLLVTFKYQNAYGGI